VIFLKSSTGQNSKNRKRTRLTVRDRRGEQFGNPRPRRRADEGKPLSAPNPRSTVRVGFSTIRSLSARARKQKTQKKNQTPLGRGPTRYRDTCDSWPRLLFSGQPSRRRFFRIRISFRP